MKSENTIRLGAASLIAAGILYPGVFTFLAVGFGYPDILDGEAREVLPRLLAGGEPFRIAWAAFGLMPLLFLPIAAGAFQALRGGMEGGMRLASHLASVSSLALSAGLLRWTTFHWELARFYAHADGSQRGVADAVFLGLNRYLGNYLGECIGEASMQAFFLLSALAMLRSPGFPRWMGWFGTAVSGLGLIALFRNVSAAAGILQDILNMSMLFPIWLIVFGVGLAMHPRALRKEAGGPAATAA